MKKKFILFVLLTVLIIPFKYVNAASADVLTLDATQTNGTINYSGTTSSGVLAVSCTLYNSSDNQIDFKSSSVSSNAFSDTFTAEPGDYTIKCANYDGGTFVTATITVPTNTNNNNTTTDDTTTNNTNNTTTSNSPKTYDDIATYFLIGIISVVGITLSIVFYRKKYRKN